MTWAWLVTLLVEVCAGIALRASPRAIESRLAAVSAYSRGLRQGMADDGFARIQQLHEWRTARIAELRRSMGVSSGR